MSYKIRIAGDNENDRSLLWNVLTFHDDEVTVAADGYEGVGLAREPMPDLIQAAGFDGDLSRPISTHVLPGLLKQWPEEELL
jgi:hypothetical protein